MLRALAPLLFASGSVAAQTTLAGTVRDSAGQPIASAQVSIEALGRVAIADTAGRFLLRDLVPGLRLVRVRRVGYAPYNKMVKVVEGENRLDAVVLDRFAFELDTVVTTGRLRPRDLAMLEFEEHRKIGLGHFVTRAQLDSMRGRPIAQAFYQLPGIQTVTSTYSGSATWLASSRGPKSGNPKCIELEDRKGRISPRNGNCLCFPKVYLDRTLISQFDIAPNVNRFLAEQLEGIEVYTGASQTPPEYAGLGSQCGVIVFHSRKIK